MKALAARRIIRAAGARGFERVEFTVHALADSLPDDGVTVHDVFHLLANADEVLGQDQVGRRWKAYGPLLGGETYAAVLVIIDGDRVRVVTTHDPP